METERLWPSGPTFVQAENAKLTTDTVLLADFAAVKAGERGADLGCGSGALMLLLMWRVPGLQMTGYEINEGASAAALQNLCSNGFDGRSQIISGDLRETAAGTRGGSFDFVISNPPYFQPGRGKSSPQEDRAIAREEAVCSLQDLCKTASRFCRSGGRSFFCYRAERLAELLKEMSANHLEAKRLRFVHHRPEYRAGIVLVEGRKDAKQGLIVEAPLILFQENGKETEEYRRIYHRT